MHHLILIRIAALIATVPGLVCVASQPVHAAPQRPQPQSTAEVPNLWSRKTGTDWPGFLGANRDARSEEKGILTDWSDQRLKMVWVRNLGEGYATGSVSRGRFFQFDRVGDRAVLDCLNAETGERLWSFSYPTDYKDMYQFNGGPRSSPVIDQNRVYLLGVEGMLHCLDVRDGRVIWKVDTASQFGVVQNFFGVGSTPVVEGNLLITMIGGSPPESQSVALGKLDEVVGNGTGIVAFDKHTGKVVYQLTDELASYSSPKLATIDGRRWCFAWMRGALVGFDPSTGEVDFQYPWRARRLETVNASTPVVVGDHVFISESYGPGSLLMQARPGKGEVVWKDELRTRKKAMETHWNTPVHHEGYLYGCSGSDTRNAELRCIEMKTGKVMWSQRGLTRCSLIYADGHLVCLGEYGKLTLLKATPHAYEMVTQIDLGAIESDRPDGTRGPLLQHPCWSAPVLSHGLLYVRGKDQLVCLELIPQ